MRNPLSVEAFADWLGKQPAEKEYRWSSCTQCAVAQYRQSLFGRRSLDPDTPLLSQMIGGMKPYHAIAGAEPHTFGAAHARARKYLAAQS